MKMCQLDGELTKHMNSRKHYENIENEVKISVWYTDKHSLNLNKK